MGLDARIQTGKLRLPPRLLLYGIEGIGRSTMASQCPIALPGTPAGRKVRGEVNTRSNVYYLGVCPTGHGKERPREVNKETPYRAGLQRLAGPEGLASHAGLVAAVELQPGILLQLDAIRRLLKTLGDASCSPHLCCRKPQD